VYNRTDGISATGAMKFGSLPAAQDPRKPTAAEIKAVQEKIRHYQQVFDTY
jgi:hypothetical protein